MKVCVKTHALVFYPGPGYFWRGGDESIAQLYIHPLRACFSHISLAQIGLYRCEPHTHTTRISLILIYDSFHTGPCSPWMKLILGFVRNPHTVKSKMHLLALELLFLFFLVKLRHFVISSICQPFTAR